MAIDLELRRRSLAASEFGSVFGVDPRRDARALWAQKKGELPQGEPQPWMRAGKRWEPHILQVWAEESGSDLELWDKTVQHPKHPWLVASCDALVRINRLIAEAKLVQWHQRHHWGASPSEVPEQYILQVAIQMAVMDFDKAMIVAWAGESDLWVYDYPRDPEMEGALVERGYEFWQRYIQGDERPPITGSEESAAWLRCTFPKNFGNVRKATATEIALLEDYTDVRIKEKTEVAEVLDRRALLENQLKETIGRDDGLAWFGGRFTWKKIKDHEETDWQALARTLLLSRPDEERGELVKRFTSTVAGYRRIHFTADRLREAAA